MFQKADEQILWAKCVTAQSVSYNNDNNDIYSDDLCATIRQGVMFS